MNNKYYVVKNKCDDAIVYFEYDKLKGLDITPKKNVKIKDSIAINKMIIINPSLIEKVIRKKLKKRFSNLLNILNTLYESTDEDPTGLREALNEITKFKLEINNKYHLYLKDEEIAINEKKLSILENEVKLRLSELTYQNKHQKEGKSR
ncbi:MAG: hypothetical protein RR359_04035 [Bacilli bacterium]